MLKIIATAISGLALALAGANRAGADVVGSDETLPYTCAQYEAIETDPGNWACFDGMPVTLKTRIYHHSPRLTMGYTSSKPVSLIWSARIRRDNSLAPDDTVFTYPDAYGSYTRVGLFTTTESQYWDGYDKLPYDRKRYFIDLFNLRLWDGKFGVDIKGSVQSDRMTCYKTTSCKFD